MTPPRPWRVLEEEKVDDWAVVDADDNLVAEGIPDAETAALIARAGNRPMSVMEAHDVAALAMSDAEFALHQTDCAVCESFGRPTDE